jgi:NDP-sugar pyrophosphorylase family protein
MSEDLEEIIKVCEDLGEIKKYNIKKLINTFFSKMQTKINSYIGDYPTFIEPVLLEENVKIGDDVLIGPNVYIGSNTEIGDYVEISNSIVFENVKIGENFKLEYCIILKNSNLNFSNFSLKNCILKGSSNSESELETHDI